MADDHGSIPVPDPTTLTTEALRRDIKSLRELLEGRISADENELQAEVKHSQELQRLRDEIAAERLKNIEVQFTLRDVAADKLAKADQSALAAALAAQKEQAGLTNSFMTLLVDKMEASFAKAIDQLGNVIKSNSETLSSKVDDLKERQTRGESRGAGITEQRVDSRLNVGMLVGILGLAIAAVALLTRAAS